MSATTSLEEGEILAEVEAGPGPSRLGRSATRHPAPTRNRSSASPQARRHGGRRGASPSASDSSSSRNRRRSRSRSRSRSWSRRRAPPPPVSADPLPAAVSASAQLKALASSIRQLTARAALPDCIKDLKGVCSRLAEAVDKVCTYCELAKEAAEKEGGELSVLAAALHSGLRSLHVYSTTGRGREMSAARPVVQRAWRERARLFSPPQLSTFTGWVDRTKSKNFAALLEDSPAVDAKPRPAMPAPARAPAPKSKSKAKSKAKPMPAAQSVQLNDGEGITRGGGALSRGGARVSEPDVQLHDLAHSSGTGAGAAGAQQGAGSASPGQSGGAQGTDERGVVPGSDTDALLRARKLCLVLDLDHTLLNSVLYSELLGPQGKWLEARAAAQAQLPPERRDLYRLDSIKMFTKLRPGVRRFLREAAEHFELWIHTNGNKAYAAAVTRLLDPDAAYFGGRVIAQGAERPEDMRPDQPKQLEQGLAAREAVSVIVDDTDSVWAAHSHNLVTVEKYGFFPSSRVAAAPARASLMEQNRDDHPESGALACTLSVLMRVHAAVFAALHTPPRHLPSGERVHANWDTRHVLSELRQGVLRGTHLVFSGVIPLGQDPQTHALWQMAARFGGSLSTTVDARATHLVAGRDGTDKVRLARLAGLHVVCPQWLETTCRQWQRADEREFRVLG